MNYEKIQDEMVLLNFVLALICEVFFHIDVGNKIVNDTNEVKFQQ